MNRVEKEMAKKRAKATKDLRAEEHDQQVDSISDAKDLRSGKNRMATEYAPKVNAHRFLFMVVFQAPPKSMLGSIYETQITRSITSAQAQ